MTSSLTLSDERRSARRRHWIGKRHYQALHHTRDPHIAMSTMPTWRARSSLIALTECISRGRTGGNQVVQRTHGDQAYPGPARPECNVAHGPVCVVACGVDCLMDITGPSKVLMP